MTFEGINASELRHESSHLNQQNWPSDNIAVTCQSNEESQRRVWSKVDGKGVAQISGVEKRITDRKAMHAGEYRYDFDVDLMPFETSRTDLFK